LVVVRVKRETLIYNGHWKCSPFKQMLGLTWSWHREGPPVELYFEIFVTGTGKG
jgi:hypothetical protein